MVHRPDTAWNNQDEVKFLAPVPGYDRHFAICEELGISMINVNMLNDGPDMDTVENLVRNDPMIKGCGVFQSIQILPVVFIQKQVVERIAALGKISGPNFGVIWDNAYGVHDLFR